MSDTSPGTEPDMDVQEDEASCPPLPSPKERGHGRLLPRRKVLIRPPRTKLRHPVLFRLHMSRRPTSSELRRVQGPFANPCRSPMLSTSRPRKSMSSRGNPRPGKRLCPYCCDLGAQHPQRVPELGQASFTLGEGEVTCRRAEREGPDYHYARVGPLDDSTDITLVRRDFRSFDGGGGGGIPLWIPPTICPGTPLKVAPPKGEWDPSHKGVHLPVGVLGTPLPPPSAPLLWVPSDRPLPQHLRSPVRCSRCSGPHPCRRDDITCTRPFRCFHSGDPHGPRSAHCIFNCGLSTHADLAREGTPLHAINTQLRDLALPTLSRALRRPKTITNQACTSSPTLPPATAVHPGYVVFRHRHRE
ncbi:hypothetical protein GWK47_020816 [Chionoecetes opilio]|uniref:Uncharacterized protein n=1 Tax=Chionoecetes opilio TaxID=41210 RepID=A0A8J4XPH7_CHIOP|nr:hypothetical protein GWK47_020816 [Chionoecetes opilio]